MLKINLFLQKENLHYRNEEEYEIEKTKELQNVG